MNKTIKAALQYSRYSGLLELAEWGLFNLADVAHYRNIDLSIDPKYGNQPEPDGYVDWEPELKWRRNQPILNALLTGYDNGEFTASDLTHTVRILTRYAKMQRARGMEY